MEKKIAYEWSCERCGASGQGKADGLATLKTVMEKIRAEHLYKSPVCQAKIIELRA